MEDRGFLDKIGSSLIGDYLSMIWEEGPYFSVRIGESTTWLGRRYSRTFVMQMLPHIVKSMGPTPATMGQNHFGSGPCRSNDFLAVVFSRWPHRDKTELEKQKIT